LKKSLQQLHLRQLVDCCGASAGNDWNWSQYFVCWLLCSIFAYVFNLRWFNVTCNCTTPCRMADTF